MRRQTGLTTSQLARICGVSQGTVDRALHNRGEISAKTKEHILSVAKKYGYIPNVKCTEGGKSMLFGVVLFDLYNEFFAKLAMSLVKTAKEPGYSVIFGFSNKSFEEERAAVEYFNAIGVDGIILFSVGCDDGDYVEYLHSLGKPVVTVGNRLSGLDYIGVDDEAAMHDLTVKVLEEVHADVAYFAPILREDLHSTNAQRLRLEGYRRAVLENQREPIIATDVSSLGEGLGGVICSTDHYVPRVIKHFEGKKLPFLAGFDNISLLGKLGKRILTVEYSTDKIAEECVKYLLGRAISPDVPYSIISSV